jgi:diguanylate cyclase (GGDEF)-like protein
MIDLDGFKEINDTLGHAAGDRVLVVTADRIRAVVDRSTTGTALAARLGGDEFAILLTTGGRPAAVALAEQVLAAADAPIPLPGRGVVARVSVGVTAPAGPDADPERLLREADLALYQAKAHGKGCYREYHPDMSADLLRRWRLESDLTEALGRDQFELAFQPIVEMRTSTVLGFEALVRWRHPERGLLTPDAFLPDAAALGLLPAIDRWVLREACARTRQWRVRRPGLTLSVNVSAEYIASGQLVDDVVAALAAGLPADALTVEVTETALVADMAMAADVLAAVRRLGVHVAVDDFGIGYSSLAYLHRLPIDTVKIDRSFVQSLAENVDAPIVDVILVLAERMNLHTVAEGIEYPEQAHRLRDLRCERAQGYLYSRPMPAGQVAGFLAAQALDPADLAQARVPV